MRVRIRFSKVGKIRWTSHRDVARMWERALRRAALPVALTQGFTPRPKLSFGLALPTGHESVAEYLDVELDTDHIDPAALCPLLSDALPSGVDVLAAAVVDDRAPSLQQDVITSTWQVEVAGAAPDQVAELVEVALRADALVITRSRKGVDVAEDVRPSIEAVTVVGPVMCDTEGHAPGTVVVADLATQPRSIRPADLLAALSPALSEGHVRRLHQWTLRDGAPWEPLGATDAPHARQRAS